MRRIIILLMLATGAAAAPPYRFLLVVGNQWEDDASFLIERPSAFQVTAALLKTWGLPFDILRLDQQTMDRYHLLERDGSPRYGTILWDVPADPKGRDLSLLAELNQQGVAVVALGDTIKNPDAARLAGLQYVSDYKAYEPATFDPGHFITRSLAGREKELLANVGYSFDGFKVIPQGAERTGAARSRSVPDRTRAARARSRGVAGCEPLRRAVAEPIGARSAEADPGVGTRLCRLCGIRTLADSVHG